MDRTELSAVAWDLIEHCRASLPAVDLNTVFVLLGIGEYGEAMVLALRTVVREPNLVLPEAMLQRLVRLQHTHFVDAEYVALLGVLTDAGGFPEAG